MRVDLRSQRIRSLKADTLHLPPAAQVGLWQVLLRCCSGAAQVLLRGNKLTAMDGIERLKKVKVSQRWSSQLTSLFHLSILSNLPPRGPPSPHRPLPPPPPQVLDLIYSQLTSLFHLSLLANLPPSSTTPGARRELQPAGRGFPGATSCMRVPAGK
ncbi:unnamed protein product [Closterium sp. NIES-64]|nr:unnamed protein product [Closterium sp. NIES-64]